MNKPQLRFKGFEDKELSLYTLEDLGTWCKGQPLSKSDIISGGSYPCIHYGELFFYNELVNKINSFTNLTPIRTTSGKELLFPDSDVTPTGLGRCCTTEQPGVILGAGINILSLSVPFNAHYCTLNIVRNNSQIIERISGTTVKHIHPKNLNEVKIAISSDIVEQISISKFFKQLDEMIAEAEREVNRLEKMKQASLQKMFPRPGAATPEIRFAGFSEPWVIGKLSDLLEIDDNRNSNNLLGREDVLSVSGEFGLVNQIEFQGRSFAGTSLHNYKITHIGQVIYTKSPLKAQPFGIVKSNQYGDGLLSPLYAVYNPINNACADFIHYYFAPVARLNNYLRPLINKGAKNTILISDETALQGEMAYPIDVKEQFYIAQYFRNIDELISAKRQKLAKLRNIKQACLDKMFVNTFEL